MRKIVLGVLLVASSIVCVPAPAATVYVSDELTVPLRRGPSNSHKILHAGLPSGTALEVLSEDAAAGFTQVRMANGTEGWVPTQYLSNEPAARDRLAAANRRIESLEQQLKTLRDTYQETRGARTQSEGRVTDLSKQTEKLQAELAEVRRISATSIANYEENKQLKASNESLQKQVTDLTARVRDLDRNVVLKWLLAGGALVVLGLVLGAWIKSRPKRSSWA
jgi:SH3 domain protein